MKKWICILLAIVGHAHAASFKIYEAGYSYHTDTNVRVENVTDVVRRQGVYFEHNIYIEFAYDFQSWFFKNYNELELSWTFSMPENVIMHQLFYWQGDSVFQADVMDRWTAEQMFNEKSSPLREPALLTMSSPTYHGEVRFQLRLFPIVRSKSQRILIRYLVPAVATSGKLRTWLPISQLTTPQGDGTEELEIIYRYKESLGAAPELIGHQQVEFEQYGSDYAWVTTRPIAYGEFLELVVPSPISGDAYLTTYTSNDSTYYELAVYPPPLQATNRNRKMLILVDYNTLNTDGVSSDLLLTSLKETLLRSFTEQDSIAVLSTFDRVVQPHGGYLPCTDDNLDDIMSVLFGELFLPLSLSQDLLNAAARFLRDYGTAELLWLTNRNDLVGREEDAHEYALDIINIFPPGTTIHMIDLENKRGLLYREDYGYVTQNFYVFYQITHMTGGNLFFLRFHPLKTALSAVFFEKNAHYEQLEIQTRMASGYTYDRADFSLFQGYYPLDFPKIQTGRLDGDFPMTVTIIGRNNEQINKKEIIIQEQDVEIGNKAVATAIHGRNLQEMAHQRQSNWLISEMVDLSVQNRVLTAYSAFIVPVLGEANHIPNFVDETQTPVAVTTEADSLLLFSAAPNPFNPATVFKVVVPQGLAGEDLILTLYNILGEQVKQVTLTAVDAGQHAVRWDAKNEQGRAVSAGTYFAVITMKNVRQTIKVLFLK